MNESIQKFALMNFWFTRYYVTPIPPKKFDKQKYILGKPELFKTGASSAVSNSHNETRLVSKQSAVRDGFKPRRRRSVLGYCRVWLMEASQQAVTEEGCSQTRSVISVSGLLSERWLVNCLGSTLVCEWVTSFKSPLVHVARLNS